MKLEKGLLVLILVATLAAIVYSMQLTPTTVKLKESPQERITGYYYRKSDKTVVACYGQGKKAKYVVDAYATATYKPETHELKEIE